MRVIVFSDGCAPKLFRAASALRPSHMVNYKPAFSLISHRGPPLYDKTGSYFYLDKELQVGPICFPRHGTGLSDSEVRPFLMGFPAPIYFRIRVSPPSPLLTIDGMAGTVESKLFTR